MPYRKFEYEGDIYEVEDPPSDMPRIYKNEETLQDVKRCNCGHARCHGWASADLGYLLIPYTVLVGLGMASPAPDKAQ